MRTSAAARQLLREDRRCVGVVACLELPDGSGVDVLDAAFDRWPRAARILLVPEGEVHAQLARATRVGAAVVPAGSRLEECTRLLLRAQEEAAAATRSGPDSGIRPKLSVQQLEVYFPPGDCRDAVLAAFAREVDLTQRQTEALGCHLRGMNGEETAEVMRVSISTVRGFMQKVRDKAGTETTAELVMRLLQDTVDLSTRQARAHHLGLVRLLSDDGLPDERDKRGAGSD